MNNDSKVFKSLCGEFGVDHYLRKIIEELNELACAISHYKDGKIQTDKLMDEMADVFLQMDKLISFLSLFGDSENVINILSDKYDDKMQNLRNILHDKTKE